MKRFLTQIFWTVLITLPILILFRALIYIGLTTPDFFVAYAAALIAYSIYEQHKGA